MSLGNTGKGFESDGLLTVTADGAKADVVLITGVTDKIIEIHSLYVSSSAVNGITELNEETSDKLLFKAFHKSGSTTTAADLHIDVAESKSLKITQQANTFTTVTYHIKPH